MIIKTMCPKCGEVDLTSDAIRLRIAMGGKDSKYSFECPRCTERIEKLANSSVVHLLISGGVTPQVVQEQPPAPTTERCVPDYGQPRPPITYDDILDFHQEILAGALESFLRNATA